MPSGGKLCSEGRTAIFDDDYAEAHPEVSPGRYVMVAVADTGCGIPRENLSHVFEPFFTTKPPGTGTGLGLSMAYGFARQSGGHLQIYSEVDRGTTVKLYLPIASPGADVHQRPGDAVPEPRRWPDTRSVLVVEDDDLVRQNVVRQLTRLGYGVTAVRDATEALGMLRSGASVDLLFSDVVLTGAMSGAELGREVRREFPAVPILFTSGYSDALIADQGHLDEDVSLLPKPYTRAELARAVERVLSTSGR
jgi:CheY-like chemotaxis protein